MKKLIPIIIVVILLGAGAYFFMNQQSGKTTTGDVTTNANGDGNIVTSIKDALTKSQTLKCEYEDEAGTKSVAYIKGGAVASEYESSGKKGHVIFKDNKTYIWEDGARQGMIFTVDEETAKEIQKDTADAVKSSGQKDIVAELEKYKENCKVSSVSNSVFTIPTDVKFTDLNEMMKQYSPQ